MSSNADSYLIVCIPIAAVPAIYYNDGHPYICEFCTSVVAASLCLHSPTHLEQTFTCAEHKCAGALFLLRELMMQPNDINPVINED